MPSRIPIVLPPLVIWMVRAVPDRAKKSATIFGVVRCSFKKTAESAVTRAG